MTFQGSVYSCLRNYATFRGRAARSEYWYFALFTLLVSLVLVLIDIAAFGYTWDSFRLSPLMDLFNLAVLLPSLAVSARRLHDIDRSAWWMLIALTGIGVLLLLYWAARRGDGVANRFGDTPVVGAL